MEKKFLYQGKTLTKWRLAPEVKVFASLLAFFSSYIAFGTLFGFYVGAPVGLLSLSLLLVFFGVMSLLLGGGVALASRLSKSAIELRPGYHLDFALLFVSLVGVAFIGIDRYFYRGIDVFGMSFAEIRAALNSEGRQRGVSSFFSVSGNLMQVMYLVVSSRLIFYWEEYAMRSFSRVRLILMLLAACLVLSSYLLGGRTLLLLFVFICAGAMLVRACFRRSIIPRRLPKHWLIMAVVGALIMSVGIFWVRFRVFGGVESADYLERLLAHVHPYSLDFSGIGVRGGGIIGDALNFLLCVFAYVFHQLWVFDAVVDSALKEGSSLLLGTQALAPSFFGAPATSTMLQGLFFSAPAAFYYDFGAFGILLGSFFFSFFSFVALAFFARSGSCGAVFFSSFSFAAVLMAPVAFVFIMPYAIILAAMSFFMVISLCFFSLLKLPRLQ